MWLASSGFNLPFPPHSLDAVLGPSRASLVVQTVNNLTAMQEIWVQSLGWENPLEKGMTTHSSILAWRFLCHGQRSLVGYIPWSCKESDMTE